MKIFYKLFVLFFILGCKEVKHKNLDEKNREETLVEFSYIKKEDTFRVKEEIKEKRVSKKQSLQVKVADTLKSTKNLFFTNSQEKDLFSLKVSNLNGNLFESELEFTIFQLGKKLVYESKFPAYSLIAHDLNENMTDLEMNDLTRKKIINFFNSDDDYFNPAVQDDFDSDYTDLDKKKWNSLKGKNILGFCYPITEGTSICILWDKNSETVIVYSYCC